MLCKLLMPSCGDPGQHFTVDYDLLAEINATINAICINMTKRIGCRLMAPSNSCRVGFSTEDVHTSKGNTSNLVHIKKKQRRLSVWQWASKNVRSLLDVEGSIETSRQDTKVANSEAKRIDEVVSALEKYV